ncbi:hypothetical protein DFR59_10549 [Falsibacillus pallidus]|uniref:Uncharacterized protein n=1 Tax=Falsibacillus pallidus TaxID=493781 RepID=A0A370GFX5_9BACI|nr:hypothetical protein DFR59_10549 [Falsibacillus pallidus]
MKDVFYLVLKVIAVLSFGGLITSIALNWDNQSLELSLCSICTLSSLILIRNKRHNAISR